MGKYFFISNTRLKNGEVATQMLGYDDIKTAEIKYHDEVSYALKLTALEYAHFEVVTESGATCENLTRTVDNTSNE